jgi:hypothetical protein
MIGGSRSRTMPHEKGGFKAFLAALLTTWAEKAGQEVSVGVQD